MKIEFESKNDGFVVLTLNEYNHLKELADQADKLWEEHIRNILKENKN